MHFTTANEDRKALLYQFLCVHYFHNEVRAAVEKCLRDEFQLSESEIATMRIKAFAMHSNIEMEEEAFKNDFKDSMSANKTQRKTPNPTKKSVKPAPRAVKQSRVVMAPATTSYSADFFSTVINPHGTKRALFS